MSNVSSEIEDICKQVEAELCSHDEAVQENEREEETEEQESSAYSIKQDSTEEQTLYQLVRNKRQKQEDTCQQWLEVFAESPEQALLTFIEFILEASGSQYQLPADLKFPLNFTSIIIAATSRFGNKSLLYPLIMKGKDIFVRDVTGFVEQLLRLMNGNPMLRHDSFLKIVSGFLLVSTDSKVRAFRHTSTLIALKMMTSLNELTSVEHEKLKQTWLQMFRGIFMLRTSDVVDDIRHLCIVECGLWLEAYPKSLLLPLHVKHLFKALQDRCSKVCQSSLQGLLKLGQNEELKTVYLEQGIKYRMTLLGLCMSVESELSQLAIELLLVFYKEKSEILDSSMLKVIEQLVFAAHRGVAQMAAKLITYRHQEAETNKDRIRVLVQLFITFGEHEHAAYLVDAFFGHNECLLAWSTMVTMLQDGESLNPEEISALIEIMTRAVQQAVTGEVPPGRYTEDLVRQPLANARMLATKALLSPLPSLIRKFNNSPEDLRNLLELPQYMSRQKAEFQELLEQIEVIMFEQADPSVLQMGAMTLEHLYELRDMKELLNNAVTNYMIAYNAWEKCSKGGGKSPAKDPTERLLHTLRLLSVLYARFDLNDWKLADNVLCILRRFVEEQREIPEELCLPEEAVSFYLTILYVSLCWDLKRLQGLAQVDKDVDADCVALRSRLEGFFAVSFSLLKQPKAASTACESFVYCCDLIVLSADRMCENQSVSMQSLEYRTKLDEYERIEAFMMSYVFPKTDEESAADLLKPEQFVELQIKRRVLTGYLKLIFHNAIPMMRACIVLQYYESHYAAFGDIMRATMEHIMSVNPTNFGMTVMHTCLLVYNSIREIHKDYAQAVVSPEFARLIRLANLLAELFNVKQLAVRPGILILHRAGIRFAVEFTPDDPIAAPKNLLYLTVVQQFVPQLLAQDMFDIYKFLQFIEYAPLPSSRVDTWQPLNSYRNTLLIALRQSCYRDELAKLEK